MPWLANTRTMAKLMLHENKCNQQTFIMIINKVNNH